MFKLDNNFLIELGLGSLPPIEKNKMLAHIYETLEMRVGMKLAEQMSNEQLDEFEGYIKQKDEAGALKWLESNFPNYKQVVAEELEKLKGEIKQVAPQIVQQAQQAAAAQPAPQAGGYPPQQQAVGQQPQQPAMPQQQYTAQQTPPPQQQAFQQQPLQPAAAQPASVPQMPPQPQAAPQQQMPPQQQTTDPNPPSQAPPQQQQTPPPQDPSAPPQQQTPPAQ